MADVPRTGTVSLASPLIPANCKHNKIAGAAITAGDACYISSADTVLLSTGAAATAPAQVDGFAAESASIGEPVTLVFNVTLRYATALTPGAKLFLSGATAGALADAASTGGTAWVAKVVDASRVYVQKSTY